MKNLSTNASRFVVLSLAVSMLLASVGISIPNVALPTLAKEFDATFPQVQWIVLSYLLAITMMIVNAGKMGDVFGRRKVFLSGIFLFSFGALLCGLVPNLWALIGSRVIQGLGAATIMTLSVAFISESVAKEKIGGAMGLMGTMSAIGTASGPTIGGIVIATFGWRSVFFLMVFLGALAFYLSFRFLPQSRLKAKAEKIEFDFLGTILLVVALAGYSLGVTLNSGSFNKIN